MACQNIKSEATAKRRRFKSTKVTAKSTQAKKPKIIDLTTEDDEQQEQKHEKDVKVDLMEVPAHLESEDYFQVLCLSRSASESDVRRAYRKLAVQWHPDKNRSNPRAEEVFKRISEAYEVLIDPEKRQNYEKYDKIGLQRGGAQTPEHFGFGRRAGEFSSQRARDIFEAFFGGEDPFEAFFGGSRQRRGSRRFGDDPFDSMGFGGMGMGMNMRGFGRMGGMSMMDSFFTNGFEGMNGSNAEMFSTSSSSSSSMFTDRSGNVIHQVTTTTTGANGRSETTTEEYRNGKLVNSSSSSTTGNRLADAGRMQLDGSSGISKRSNKRW